MKNKEITIYELMGLIKDNKAPNEIKVRGGNNIYKFNKNYSSIEELYLTNNRNRWFDFLDITLETEFEILPEENDEWEDIENVTLNGENIKWDSVEEYLDFPNDNEQKISSCIDGLGIAMNRLIKNQKYLKEKLESKDE